MACRGTLVPRARCMDTDLKPLARFEASRSPRGPHLGGLKSVKCEPT